MALSIKEILASAKIEGLELVKVKTGGEGDYFLATLGGIEKSIMVHTIGQLTRAEWVDELRWFAEQVAALAPAEEVPADEGFTPPPQEPSAEDEAAYERQLSEEEPAANEAPAAPARSYNRVDASASYRFIGDEGKRREGSTSRAYQDWLIANPGSTAEQIKAAGHDLKHLRWDIKVGAVEEV